MLAGLFFALSGFLIFPGLLVFPTIYFLPTIIGFARKSPQTAPVFFVNLYLGWSVIGWIVALVLALR